MSNDTATRQTIARAILSQLGGSGRLRAMIGAKHFGVLESGLSFRLPTNFAKNGINQIIINLTAEDLYDVTFNKITQRTYRVIEIANHKGIYFDQLKRLISDETGLDLSL